MKTPILYIEARKNLSNVNLSPLDKLPGKTVSLAAVIQYIDLIPKVKNYLEKKGKKVIIKKGAYYAGHSIGCNPSAFDSKADTLLLIGDGKFQAINNATKLEREIYIFNTQSLTKITKEELESVSKKIKGKINKFLHSEKVGIIVSTKLGQHYNIGNLVNKIKKKGKKPYIFESDTINTQELENFPDIKIWINTACYGLASDSNKIINFQDVLEFL